MGWNMRNIWHVFKRDWKRVFSKKLAILLMVALMFVPSLYAWFNIKALWDPFNNTKTLPVAVYSADKTVDFEDHEVNLGDDVLDKLHHNHKLGWKFVKSKKDLNEGVKSGKYYAGIYITEDFTKNLLSFLKGDIKKPEIEYCVNTKINAIAPRITDKGANTIKDEISKEFAKTTSSTLAKAFSDLGYDLDHNLPALNKVKYMIFNANKNVPTIDNYIGEIEDVYQKMPLIKSKINQVGQFLTYLPEVDAGANKLLLLQSKLPEIRDKMSIILQLNQAIPTIEDASKQLNMMDQSMGKVSNTLNGAITSANKGLQVLTQVQNAIPQLKSMINNAESFNNKMNSMATKLDNSLNDISKSLSTVLESLKSVSTDVAQVTQKLEQLLQSMDLTDAEKEAIQNTINNTVNSLKDQINSIDTTLKVLNELNNFKPNPQIQEAIDRLNNTKTILTGICDRLEQIDMSKVSTAELQDLLNNLNKLAKELNQSLNKIDVKQITSEVHDLLQKLLATSKNLNQLIQEAKKVDFDGLINSTKQTVNNALTLLNQYKKALPNIANDIHQANMLVQKNKNSVIDMIRQGTSFYQTGLPKVEAKLNQLANFIRNDWPGLEKELVMGYSNIQAKLPELESGLNFANDFIQKDWPSLKKGLAKMNDGMKKFDENVNINKLIKALKGNIKKESDFFADPIKLKTKEFYPMPNNGTASTPFYTALCLWVGALLFSSITTTKYHEDEEDKKYNLTNRQKYLGRMLTYVTVGIAQALIVSLGNYYLLGVGVKEFGYSLIFGVFISIVFMCMVYTLVAIFGTFGKGLAIVILVLSVAGGGGNYPIEVSGPFFQFINPLLPFTYACDLLREAIGGIYWPNANHDLIILTIYLVVSFVIGVIIYPHVYKIKDYIEEQFEDSKLFH